MPPSVFANRREPQPYDIAQLVSGWALSQIYFAEDGILGVLRRLETDDEITDDDRDRLVDFNQREAEIDYLLEELVLDYGRFARNSISQSRMLDIIRNGKKTLRRSVQGAINRSLTFDEEVDKNKIAQLISDIDALNEKIAEVEHELRVFM